MVAIKNCPGTLAEGYSTYSAACLSKMFNRKKVSHILPYETPLVNAFTNNLFVENKQRISISGVQEKCSLVLDKNKLRLVNESEQGQYILKTIPKGVTAV